MRNKRSAKFINSEKKFIKSNPWRAAFIALVGIIIVLCSILMFKITRPIDGTDKYLSQQSGDAMFSVSVDKDQVNRISKEYLTDFLKTEKIKYAFKLDKHANIYGKVKFLGANVPFKLILDPYMKENGDVRLKAKSLKFGALPVPMNFVISYIGHSYHLPDWVKLNSKKKIIDLKLTKYKTKEGYSIRAKKLDLIDDRIQVEVFKEGI